MALGEIGWSLGRLTRVTVLERDRDSVEHQTINATWSLRVHRLTSTRMMDCIRDVRRFTGFRDGIVEPNMLDSWEFLSFVESTRVSTTVGTANVRVAPSFRFRRIGGACCRQWW